MNLKDWKARRAGGRITVTGTDENGNDAKITNVEFVEPVRNHCRAVDKDGNEHHLSMS